MSEILNELDFKVIDEAIEHKRLNITIPTVSHSVVGMISEWDNIPVEEPAAIFNSKYNWSNYKPEDDKLKHDINKDLETWDADYELFNPDDTYNNIWPFDDLAEDVIKKDINPSIDLNDLYDMILALEIRLDKISLDMANLTDMVSSQYSSSMKMIKAIYNLINVPNSGPQGPAMLA